MTPCISCICPKSVKLTLFLLSRVFEIYCALASENFIGAFADDSTAPEIRKVPEGLITEVPGPNNLEMGCVGWCSKG
jgi:hypothetical protein